MIVTCFFLSKEKLDFLYYRRSDQLGLSCRLRVATSTTSAYIPPNDGEQRKKARLIIQLGVYHIFNITTFRKS